MAWRRIGNKPLSETNDDPIHWLTHICSTRGRWVLNKLWYWEYRKSKTHRFYVIGGLPTFRVSIMPYVHNSYVNTLSTEQNGHHFAEDIFKCTSVNKNAWKFHWSLWVPLENKPTMVQVMAWCRPGDRPLFESILSKHYSHNELTTSVSANWCYVGLLGWQHIIAPLDDATPHLKYIFHSHDIMTSDGNFYQPKNTRVL